MYFSHFSKKSLRFQPLISFFHTTPDWFFLNAFTLDFAFLASLSVAHGMNLISAIKFFTPPINKRREREERVTRYKVFVQVPRNQL